jgi:hypothetical protein
MRVCPVLALTNQFASHDAICAWLKIDFATDERVNKDGSIPTFFSGYYVCAKGGVGGVLAHAAFQSAIVRVKAHELKVVYTSVLHSTGRK